METKLEDQILDVVKENLNTIQFKALKKIMDEHESLSRVNSQQALLLREATSEKEKLEIEVNDLRNMLSKKLEIDERESKIYIKEKVLEEKERCAEKRVDDFKYLVETVFKSRKTFIRETGFNEMPFSVKDYNGNQSVETRSCFVDKTFKEEEDS